MGASARSTSSLEHRQAIWSPVPDTGVVARLAVLNDKEACRSLTCHYFLFNIQHFKEKNNNTITVLKLLISSCAFSCLLPCSVLAMVLRSLMYESSFCLLIQELNNVPFGHGRGEDFNESVMAKKKGSHMIKTVSMIG